MKNTIQDQIELTRLIKDMIDEFYDGTGPHAPKQSLQYLSIDQALSDLMRMQIVSQISEMGKE